jgi:hypothetical protein
MNKKELLIGAGVIAVAVYFGLMAYGFSQKTPLGAVSNYFDTSASSISHATTTINTTSTQLFSSTTKWSQMINDTNAVITCSLDKTGTTAASSTVASGRGLLVYTSSSAARPNSIMFGECYPGSLNCYPHKGAVNCLASAAVIVTYWQK